MPPKKALAKKSIIAKKRTKPASDSDSDDDALVGHEPRPSCAPLKHHKAEGDKGGVSGKSQAVMAAKEAAAAAANDPTSWTSSSVLNVVEHDDDSDNDDGEMDHPTNYIDEKGHLFSDLLDSWQKVYDSKVPDRRTLLGRGKATAFLQWITPDKPRLTSGYYAVSFEVFVQRYERFLGTMDRLLRGVDAKGKPLPADDAARYVADERALFDKVAVEMSKHYDDAGNVVLIAASNNTQVVGSRRLFQSIWQDPPLHGGRIIAAGVGGDAVVWTQARFDALAAAMREATAAILQERAERAGAAAAAVRHFNLRTSGEVSADVVAAFMIAQRDNPAYSAIAAFSQLGSDCTAGRLKSAICELRSKRGETMFRYDAEIELSGGSRPIRLRAARAPTSPSRFTRATTTPCARSSGLASLTVMRSSTTGVLRRARGTSISKRARSSRRRAGT
jgi:hypothetical protein